MHESIAFPLLLALTLPAFAAEAADPDTRVRTIAPYLDEQTLAVAHVDLSRVDAQALTARVVQLGKPPAQPTAEFTKAVEGFVSAFRQAGGKDLYVFVSLADLPQSTPFLIAPVGANADARAMSELLKGDPSGPFNAEVVEKLDHVIFAGSRFTRRRLAGLKPAARPDLARALAAAGDTAAQLLILPSADMRRALKDSLPQLPPQLGGAPITVFTDGVVWGALGIDPPPHAKAHLFIQSRNDQAAKQLSEWVAGFWARVAQENGVREAVPNFNNLTKYLTPTAQGDHLTLDATDQDLTTVLAPLARQFLVSSVRARSQNNLRQIAIALHNFHDEKGHFPPAAIFGKDGKPLLSWRVAILPYVDQAELFKEFKLDEPWDSEHNKKLIAKMPANYRAQPGLPAGKTTYLGVAGKSAMFPPGPKPVRIQDVVDGVSNTIFFVEADAGQAVTWTKPEDYNYDPAKPLDGLGKDTGGFNAAFVDGSARFISNKIDPKTLAALFTRDGGEVVGEVP